MIEGANARETYAGVWDNRIGFGQRHESGRDANGDGHPYRGAPRVLDERK